MIYYLNVIFGAFEKNNIVVNFFYIYPRFRLQEGTLLFSSVKKFINKNSIGDNFKKLNFKESYEAKYLNGIIFVDIFKKTYDFLYEDWIKMKKFGFNLKNDTPNCANCDFNRDNFCELYKGKIKNLKYKCDFWEEKF